MKHQCLSASPPSLYILGMRVDILPAQEAVTAIIARAKSAAGGYCCVGNVHQCVLTHDDPQFRRIVNGADLVLSDSTILQRSVGFRHGVRLPSAARGAELMLELCRAAECEGIPIALIGGRTEPLLTQLIETLNQRFPRLDIAFAFSPPFREPAQDEADRLIAELRASRAQLVFVGIGCPKQERWMATYRDRLDAFMIGVGAAFDFNSGQTKPSPPWVHRAGFEWLFRMSTEPRRLWRRYLATAPRFLFLLLRDCVRNRRSGTSLSPKP